MYFRKKYGKGFTYKDANGKTVKDTMLKKWFKSLVIPPAWTEVEINEKKYADLLATGRDAKNRKQYIYHPNFRKKKNQEKFNRIIRFAENLEHMRRVTGQYLRQRKMTREKVLSTMLRLMDQAYFRPGSAKYTKRNKSYGLTTIRKKHLDINDDEITFTYIGKSSKPQERHIESERLAKIIKQLDDIPGYRVFKYFDEHNNKVEVESSELNDFIHEIMGEDFSAKDFRTWAGTMIAAIALDGLGAVSNKDQKLLKENVRNAVIMVSEKLGNTPTVARNSYIDPRVIKNYTEGKTASYFLKQVKKILANHENLSEQELSVLCMLKENLKEKQKNNE